MHEQMMNRELNADLLELLAENPDIQVFFDRMTELLGNPLTMVDTRFRIMYASRNVEIEIPLWKESITEHFVSESIISSMEKNEILAKIRKGVNHTFHSDLPGGYSALRTPLFYRGKFCGFLGLYDYIRPFKDTDASNLIAAARALTIFYNADSNILGAMDDTRDSYFLELIKCGTRDMAEILTRRNSSYQLGSDKTLICLTRRIEGMSAENVAFGRLREYLRQGIYTHVSAVYNHHLLLLFSMRNVSSATRRSICASIEECCKKYDLYAGQSFPFEDDSFIPLAYKQALKASLYAEPGDKTLPHICSYEDYFLYDVMNASLRVYPAALYEHPIVTRLSAYDKEFGTKYLDTLRTYLLNFCNMKSTAVDLGVHYNTIKYRFSMIEEIMGRDIRSDPELLMRLAMSLRIRDYAGEHRRLHEGAYRQKGV